MSLYGYLPHEYRYALFLADHYDLYPWESMIRDMVSERYPRDEDDDDASVEDSDEDEVSVEDSNEVAISVEDSDKVAISDEDSDETPSAELSSSDLITVQDSEYEFIFGSFGQASDAIPVFPITTITPSIEGKLFKIGEIECSLSLSESVTVTEQQSSNLEIQDFSSAIVYQCGNDVDQFSCRRQIKERGHLAAMVLQSSETTGAYTTTSMVKFLSDFFVTRFSCSDFVFDPGGAFSLILVCFDLKVLHHIPSRLWWIPWDRGKKGLYSFDSIHAVTEAHFSFLSAWFGSKLRRR